MLTPPTVSIYPGGAGTISLDYDRRPHPSETLLGEILHNKITVKSSDESWTVRHVDVVRHRLTTNSKGEVSTDETWIESQSYKGILPDTEWIWDREGDYYWTFPPNSFFIDWSGSGSIHRGSTMEETVSVTVYMERCCAVRINANGSTGGEGYIGGGHYFSFAVYAEHAGNPFDSAYLFRKSNAGYLPVGWYDSAGNKIWGIKRDSVIPPITWQVGLHEYSYVARFMRSSHMPLCNAAGELVHVEYNGKVVGHF